MIQKMNTNCRKTGSWRTAVGVAGLLAIASAALAAEPKGMASHFNAPGDVLIADQFNNRVIECDPSGNIIWQFGRGPDDFTAKSPIGVNDSQRVGVLTLMAGTGTPAGVIPEAPNGAVDNRVMLVNRSGQIVWQYGKFGQTGSGFDLLNTPVQCTWLPSGHVLITDQANNRIIEVDMQKRIVWQYPGSNTNPGDQLNGPNSAELLSNGHILISDQSNDRVLEVNRHDIIINTYTAGGTLGAVAFASRLKNGDTLMTDAGNSRAVEVDADDNIVWQYYTDGDPNSVSAPAPTRAVRLENGDTLISDQFNNRVIRVDSDGDIVADYGLPLAGGGAIGVNSGYDTGTTQNGLYAPYDAKIIGDYTGLTPPFRGGGF
jgi:hypothetical protein